MKPHGQIRRILARFYADFVLVSACLLTCAPLLSSAAQLVLNHPAPTVNSFSPVSAVAGSPSITLYIMGNNFVDGAIVTFGGQQLNAQDIAGSRITVSIPSSALVQAGLRQVSVTNPPPGGGTTSALMPFQVTSPPPQP
jgi:hypothetical protein